MLLFELLTGRRPFVGDTLAVLRQHTERDPPTPSALRPELDRALDTLVLAAMHKRPSRRPHAAAMEAAMEAWLEAPGGGWPWAVTLLDRLHQVAFDAPMDRRPDPDELAGDPTHVLGGGRPGLPEEDFDDVLARMKTIEAGIEEPDTPVLTPDLADALVEVGRKADEWRRLRARLVGLRRTADGHGSTALDALRATWRKLHGAPSVAALLPGARVPGPLRTRGS